jgi:glyoxylase-like metal-dependent hydrolase (beta-lactamase superfamily II)
MSDRLEVRALAVGPFQSNCFVTRGSSAESTVVIDPGDEPGRVAAALDEWGAEPQAILLTHAHVDHVGGVAELVRRYGAPVYVHPDDLPIYNSAPQHAALFGIRLEEPPPPDVFFEHGQRVIFGDLDLEVRHAPGHSPGGVVLSGPGQAFVGDCVFAGSIGRTDLPGGDATTLLRSIREQILTLPGDTVLHTGHGPSTTVEREAGSNPFLIGDPSWWVG